MALGAFSVSLVVKNLQASKVFYQNFGFEMFHGDESQNWLIMKNGQTVIGLFQGMFDNNILTFNPGWDQEGGELAEFADVREIQRSLKEAGIELLTEAGKDTSGPASFMVLDPRSTNAHNGHINENLQRRSGETLQS